mgnify:FL=1
MLHLSLGCVPLPLFRLDTGAVGAIMWKNPQWGEKGRNAMILETIHLGDLYPFLREKGRDPVLRAYLPDTIPETEGRKRPGLLIVPGGGYGVCTPREEEPIALKFLPEGYNVFILIYSVAPHGFPTQLREVAAAMEVIRDRWERNGEPVVMLGFSAGGHLTAHYANAYDWPEVRAVFPDSKPVQGTILCYPVITAEPERTHRNSFERLLGHRDLTDGEIRRFSCQNLVSEKTPPAFLWTTAADEIVPAVNSLLYAKALSDHGVPFELHVYPTGRHGNAAVDDQTCAVPLSAEDARGGEWVEEAKRWLRFSLLK